MNGWKRFFWIAVLLITGLLAASQAEAAAALVQDETRGSAIATAGALGAAVRGVEDGAARFEFDARPEVWGDGRHWMYSNDGSDFGRRSGKGCRPCTNGPVKVTVRVERGRVVEVDSQVGGSWKESGVDLGWVGATAAADYLLGLVESDIGDEDSAKEAMQAAVAADGVDIWERLLRLARDRARDSEIRSTALFWVAQEAGHRAAEDIEDIAVRSEEDRGVQEAAVFALTQLPGDRSTDVLLRLARENRNPGLLPTVYFWLGQTDDPRAAALFEEVLLRD